VAGEILSAQLNTLHNLAFYQWLMRSMREALAAGRFADFARPFLLTVEPNTNKTEDKIWQI
jgi:tRNA-guanine family transglycosylase